MKLSEANKLAANLVEKLAANEIKRIRDGGSGLTKEDLDILFLIRDGHGVNILDPYKLEEYDNCYDVDIWA